MYELWASHANVIEDDNDGDGGDGPDDEDGGVGGGFGDAAKNRRVERAAMKVVMTAYRSEDYDVKDVSLDKRGWDVTARKHSEESHIEVKGVAGSLVTFLLTAREFNKAKVDPQWVLVAVTKALTTGPQYYELDSASVLAHARPYMYKVSVPEDSFA